MSTWDSDIVRAFEQLGGTATYEKLYSELNEIRGDDLPQSWKSIVRRRVQDLSSDSAGFKNGRDLFFSVEGLGKGVWGLRSYVGQTPAAFDLPNGVNEPSKVYSVVYRVLRDTALARKIKLLHRHECQICGGVIRLQDGDRYSEAHHVIPLGTPHNGPDSLGNILVLCPNCHVLMDFGAIQITLDDISVVEGHVLSRESLDYHNQTIFGSKNV